MENLKRSHNLSARQQIGAHIEQLACCFLEKQALVLLKKNFRTRWGEIDLIMHDTRKQILVFIEVRYRQSQRYGGALESIDFYKQQHIINAADIYLLRYPQFQEFVCRFDVVLVSGSLACPVINWITNAFECH